jgi:hypothetical protein
MNSVQFAKLSASQKKKIVKSAVRGANEDQRMMVEEYERRTRKSDGNTSR